jgi:hypothetical protein
MTTRSREVMNATSATMTMTGTMRAFPVAEV